MFTLKLHLLNHLVGDLERSRRLATMVAGPFQHCSVLIKKLYRMKSWRLSKRMHEIGENMSSTVDNVQTLASEVHGSVAGASLLSKSSA